MKNRTYSKSIADAINSFLTEDDWHFSFDDQRGLFKFGLNLKGRIKNVRYIVDVKDDEYVVYAISPIGADEDDEKKMAIMAEFICRANYGLKNGNFELDMRDGEIRYKSFVDCEGLTPTTEMVRNSIHCPAAMFDRYGDGIVDIIFGNSTAKEAVAKCEKSPEEELRALLGEEFDGDDDMEAMIARLAARFEIDESELHTDGETADSSDGETEVKTDLFGTEGGVA
jgi:hypothetical protein